MYLATKQLMVGLVIVGVAASLGIFSYRLARSPEPTTPDNRTTSDLLSAGYVQRSTETSADATAGVGAPTTAREQTRAAATNGALQIAVMRQSPWTTTGSGQFTLARAGSSYTAALAEHGTYRLQINGCAARPPHQTYANGSWVMMDNRSSVPVVLSYNGQRYPISRYGYQVVRLESEATPQAIQVDCWNGRYWANNAAQITLQ